MPRPPHSSLRVVRGIVLVYSLVFLIGTYTHLPGVLTYGWLAWPVPRAIGLYSNHRSLTAS
ncbi:hypothetical protein [Hymenobacter profundi]|uniref:Uncharacterized protein n=1 Tax=Hymenobacter profundi TaxID=1982110 RepID=A0ABS6WVU9_9BACT|nr:hypothetical protein [Hymenobacter profundi]MBW3127732.1 hypothetical protein [Hymenobacter profundi]